MRRADNERVFFHSRIRGFQTPGRYSRVVRGKAYGFYERRGLLFCRRSKKPVTKFTTTVKFCIRGTRDAAESADLAEYLLKYEGYTQKDLRKTNLRKITSQVDYEDLDSRMCCEYFCDQWAHNHDPAAEFAHFIDGLSIGVENPKAAKIGKPQEARGFLHRADVLRDLR